MKKTSKITINPDAPDSHWVSPSGSDCWCTVGELKALLKERDRLDKALLAERERCAAIVQKLVLAGRVADYVVSIIRSGVPAEEVKP